MSKNPISIEVLETLDAIDRRGSFAKASEELNKATSAVSYAIQRLEEQLDIALFQRQGRRSVLTPAGRLILDEGRKVLLATEQLANAAKQLSTGWEPRINVAVESIIERPKVIERLHQFLEHHPNVEIDLRECVLNGGWEALELDQVDLVIGAPGPAPAQKGFRFVELVEHELLAVIATSHPLKNQLMHSIDAFLPKVRRVVTHDTSVGEISRTTGLASGGRIFYVQTIGQKLDAIVAGVGIGHLPKHLAEPFLSNGTLTALPLDRPLNRQNFMAWKLSNKGKGLRSLTELIAKVLAKT